MTAGYYWVKLSRRWQPAEYFEGGYWLLIGYEGPVEESEIGEIGEKLEHA